jgi:transposase-like protein
MEDPPIFSTMLDFEEQFKTDQDCYGYLQKFKWPEGFMCPRCGHSEAWTSARGMMICRKCEHHNSLTAGTIFHGSNKPLRLWFRAIWYVTEQKNGVSALGLQRALGLGSYHTAWAWLHKLRCAMVSPGRDRLSGIVEVDEAFYGGVKKGKRGRGADGKALLFIATEDNDGVPGRVRLVQIWNASAESLTAALNNTVEPGSIVRTDGWKGYAGIKSKGYQHEIISKENAELSENLLPMAHLNISLFKRWILGTHQGAIGHDHIGYYLDEFTFRFNRRRSEARGLLFQRLVENAMQVDPVPEELLVGGNYELHHN